MKDYTLTAYFKGEVLRKRPYLGKEWCIDVVGNFEKMEQEEDGLKIPFLKSFDQSLFIDAFPSGKSAGIR